MAGDNPPVVAKVDLYITVTRDLSLETKLFSGATCGLTPLYPMTPVILEKSEEGNAAH
jgi:hypothetical protein